MLFITLLLSVREIVEVNKAIDRIKGGDDPQTVVNEIGIPKVKGKLAQVLKVGVADLADLSTLGMGGTAMTPTDVLEALADTKGKYYLDLPKKYQI